MRLLVVDDEPGVQKSIQVIAGTLGWDALASDQFGDVVRLVREQAIDVLVCDYRMPPLTGFHIVRQLREAAGKLATALKTVARNSRNRDRHNLYPQITQITQIGRSSGSNRTGD